MRERQLERIMSDFYHNKFNVLVCSTIIENGIDIPNANTIIMERADKLGLAQLHQLRGRVGRSHHQAYAYLLTPDPKAISADGKKRLDAIASTTELGAGFNLASHDLEIRGAGELLGEEQSGQMQTLGFTLYMEMLEQAVNAIKSGETPSLELELDQGVDINLHIPALIPDDYLPDVSSRLAFYKRIASAKNNDQLDALQAEMIDRFGLLTTPSKHLFRIAQLKLTANKLGIDKIDAGDQGGYLLFKQTTPIVPTALIKLLQAQPQVLRLTAANKLKFTLDLPNAEERLQQVEKLLQHLAASTSINKGKEYV
jgi:transcription-repair coupling factor (superfamily II helicase)